jgi:TrpR-related protein YerC/YecD
MSKLIKPEKDIKELFNAFSKIESPSERERFFYDLLTSDELNDIARRWKVATMLENKTPFSEIENKTGMSSTTIARISKWLKSGYGGMSRMIKKTKK